MRSYKYIIGVDEVGRGPIAGPVTVGAVLLPDDYSWKNFKGLRDSKKLTEANREVWFSRVRKTDSISYAVSSVSEKIIDSRGIVHAIKVALSRSLKKLDIEPEDCLVLLDGGLYAPDEYKNQSTIIKGDQKEFSISLASIIAKVSRDKKMVDMGKEFPGYGFEKHKGYGTRQHMVAIKELGMLDVHRKSFLKNIV